MQVKLSKQKNQSTLNTSECIHGLMFNKKTLPVETTFKSKKNDIIKEKPVNDVVIIPTPVLK